MGSITFDGVRFGCFSDDHRPAHVHAFYAGIEVIVEIDEARVRRAKRRRNVRPADAKDSDIAHVLNTAAKYRHELLDLWRKTRAASDRG